MKRSFIFIFFIFSTALVFIACSKSDPDQGVGNVISFSCAGISPKFSADIQPILNATCSYNSNCHAAGSLNFAGPLTNHAEVFAKITYIRSAILSGYMPQSSTISQAEINAFICWIDSGAPNN